MNEYGSMSEVLNVICGVILVLVGASETYRNRDNSGARLMGLMVCGMGLLLLK